jgi:cobalt-zinc-cadmium resistance protein CzcA
MALTVIIALAFAFILSLTFVPAMIAIWLSKKVEEKDGRIITWLKKRYEPGLDRAMKRPTLTIGAGVGALWWRRLPSPRSARCSCRSSTKAIC